jgi:hypothetical protein
MKVRKKAGIVKVGEISIEETNSKIRIGLNSPVLRFLLNLCHRPALRFGWSRDARSRHRNTNFASFMAENNRRRHDIDRHDAILRGRRVARNLLMLLLAGGGTWIVVESAKALSVF